jgi:hypothetical protein
MLLFAAETILILLGIVVVGYGPVRLLVGRPGYRVLAAAPSVGLLVIVVLGGFTALADSGGIQVPLVTELLLVALASTLIGARDVFRVWRWSAVDWSSLAMRASGAGIVVATSVVWFIYLYRSIWKWGTLPVASMNNDVLSYAYLSRHLATLGLGSPGWIIGYDAGQIARGDVLGAFSTVIAAAFITGDELTATLPLMCGVVIAGSLAVLVAVRTTVPTSRTVPILAALLVQVGFIATYEIFQYFLAERIAVTVMTGAVAVMVIGKPSVARRCMLHALVASGLILAYPQVIIVYVGLAMGVELSIAIWRSSLSGSRRYGQVVAIPLGIGIGALFLGAYLIERVERARYLLTVVAGWPMPTVSMFQSLGLASVDASSVSLLVAVSGPLVVGVILVVLLCASRKRGRMGVGIALALLWPCTLFVRFAWVEPGSYRQWKAMALAEPFLVMSVVIGLSAFAALTQQIVPWHRVPGLVLVVFLGCWLAIGVTTRFDATSSMNVCPPTTCPIGDAYRAALQSASVEVGTSPTAVEAPGYWATMSAAYLLWGRPLALRTPTYFPSSSERTPFTVVVSEDGSVAVRRG